MLTTPAFTPVTMPVDDPTVAIVRLCELHIPPGVASLSAVVAPTQTLSVPVMAPIANDWRDAQMIARQMSICFIGNVFVRV